MLGPIADAAFAFSLENLRASDGNLREAGRLPFLRAQAKNCFRKQNFFPGAIIHKEHPVPCRFQIQRAAGIRSGSSCRLAHIADGERIFQKRRILLNLVGNQFFFWRFFRRGGHQIRSHRRTHGGKIRIVPEGEEGVGLSNVRGRNPVPDQIERRARGHLRRLERSLRARRVRPEGHQESGNRQEKAKAQYFHRSAPQQMVKGKD